MYYRSLFTEEIMKRLSLILLICVVSSCATKLTPQGKKVRVAKNDPPRTCKELEFVSAQSDCSLGLSWCTKNSRKKVRNEVAMLGGNYFRLETQGLGQVAGTAFKCKKRKK